MRNSFEQDVIVVDDEGDDEDNETGPTVQLDETSGSENTRDAWTSWTTLLDNVGQPSGRRSARTVHCWMIKTVDFSAH